MLSGDGDQSFCLGFGRKRPCRVMGKIDDDQFRLRLNKLFQIVRVVMPVFVLRFPKADGAANTLRHLIEGLVGGCHANNMIAGLEGHVHQNKIGLTG